MTGATTTDGVAGMRGYRYKHGDRPLAGYTIQRAAGRGGSGEVYYALSDSGREVALKVVHAYEEVELRGIGQCMNLKSPHLVSIFDVRYADDGQPVVIMEYVSGPSLRELLDESPAGFGAQKAAFFLREIGKGLTYLHDCGIVHRDLKPANIFYENGYVKIVDYGLSKVISASHRSAQTVTVGTLHYMAPEVGGGRYDRSVDIYALGALLYEMMTGQPPFFGISPAEVLMKHISAQVNVDGVEEPFATVIRKALAKDPNERYQTVQEMVEAVFGAEHVRQSVSCFSPADLSVVAGRVAQQAGLGAGAAARPATPLSSRAFEVGAKAGVVKGIASVVRQVGRRVQPLLARVTCPSVRNRIPWLRSQRQHAGAPVIRPRVVAAPEASAAALVDPLSVGHRVLLSVIAVVAVAVAAGAFADHHHPVLSSVFVLLGTVGATVGVTLASVKVLPLLGRESRLLRHLAAGGLGGMLMLLCALPAWVSAPHITAPPRSSIVRGTGTVITPGGYVSGINGVHMLDQVAESVAAAAAPVPAPRGFPVGETLAGICVSLLVVDWAKRTAAGRAERVSLARLLVAGFVSIVAAAVLGGAPEVVIAVICGTCIAVQIAAPWHPGRAFGAQGGDRGLGAPGADVPLTAYAPAGMGAGGTNVDRPLAMQSAHRPLEFATVYDVARRSMAVGKAAVVWPIRAALFAVAGALVLATLLLSLGVAFDLPGLLASGRIDSRMPAQIQREMGVENWPLVMRTLGVGGMFVIACLGVTLLMWLRRSSGGMHMLRAALGMSLLLWAPFVMAGAGIDWFAAPTGRLDNGWEFWQAFTRGMSGSVVVRAAVLMAAGVLLLLWPAPPKTAQAVAGQPVAADSSNAATANA